MSTDDGFCVLTVDQLISSEEIGIKSKRELIKSIPYMPDITDEHEGAVEMLLGLISQEVFGKPYDPLDSDAVLYYEQHKEFLDRLPQEFFLLLSYTYHRREYDLYNDAYQLLRGLMTNVCISRTEKQEALIALMKEMVSRDQIFKQLFQQYRRSKEAGIHGAPIPLSLTPAAPSTPPKEYFDEHYTVPVISGIRPFRNPYAPKPEPKRRLPWKKFVVGASLLGSVAGAAFGLQQAVGHQQSVPETVPTVAHTTPVTTTTPAPTEAKVTPLSKLTRLYGSAVDTKTWIGEEDYETQYANTVRTLEILSSHGGMSTSRLQELAQKAVEKNISYGLFLKSLLALPRTAGNGISQNLVLKYQQLHQQTRREVLTSAHWTKAVRTNFRRDAQGNYLRQDIRDSIETTDHYFLQIGGGVGLGDPLEQ